MAFAIPANTVRWVVGEILRYGHVRRPWIGLDVARASGGPAGLLVVRVYPGSPASRAGIRPGDFLVMVGDTKIRGLRDVVRVLEHDRVGQDVQLTIARGALLYRVRVRLGERPKTAAAI